MWDRTDCPWRIAVNPDTTPKWKVLLYGKDGADFRHKDPQLLTKDPETTLSGLFNFIKTGCDNNLSDKPHITQSIHEHARNLFQNVPSSNE